MMQPEKKQVKKPIIFSHYSVVIHLEPEEARGVFIFTRTEQEGRLSACFCKSVSL